MADLSLPQGFPQDLGLSGQFKTLIILIFEQTFMLLNVCFVSLSCWETQDLHPPNLVSWHLGALFALVPW